MRKDLFLVATRLIGLWQICGSLVSFAYIISDYIGYIRPQSYSHQYYMLRFVVEFLIGLFLLIRPNRVLGFVEFLTPNGEADNLVIPDKKEPRSKVK